MEVARRSLRLHDERGNPIADEYENNYILNVEKLLNKKLDSAKRTNISYKTTNRGLTAQLDAVSYELFLYACQQFYSNSDNNYEYTKTNVTDKKGNSAAYISCSMPSPKQSKLHN